MLPYALFILPCGVVRLYLGSEMESGNALFLISLAGLIELLRRIVTGCESIPRKVILTHGLLELVQWLLFLICILGTSFRYLYFAVTSTVICLISQVNITNSRFFNAILIAKHFTLWFAFSSAESGLPFPYCLVIFTAALMLIKIDHYSNLAKDRHSRVIALQEEERKLRDLLQAIPDGVLVVSSDQKLCCWNRSLLSLLSTEKSELGSKLKELKLEHGELLLEAIQRFIRKPFPHNSLGTTTFGSICLEWKANNCTWGNSQACILTARDTTDWKEMQRRLTHESTIKTALIRSVSHELRTPTNAIINLVKEISEVVPVDVKADMEVVNVCSHFLLSMINDLLDFSKVLAGKFSLVKARFDLVAELEFVVKLFRPQTRTKGIDLRLNIDPFLPKMIYSDCTRLQQILLNLLSNAVKFTTKGSIRLTVSQPYPAKVLFTVTDTGIGIPETKHRSIFQIYGKLEGNEELNPQGNGLGLGISNMLAKELGGREIDLASIEGKGSTFSFLIDNEEEKQSQSSTEVDIYPSEEAEVAEESEAALLPYFPADSSKTSAGLVLVVDDSEFNRLVLLKLLRSLGVQAEETGSGREAVEKVRRNARKSHFYRLIFMDLEMPEMNGLAATNEIYLVLHEYALPVITEIIACSAYSSEEDRQRCAQAGMTAYLEKPISREAVADRLRQSQLLD
jgi:CheY-like chemotaxis protein